MESKMRWGTGKTCMNEMIGTAYKDDSVKLRAL